MIRYKTYTALLFSLVLLIPQFYYSVHAIFHKHDIVNYEQLKISASIRDHGEKRDANTNKPACHLISEHEEKSTCRIHQHENEFSALYVISALQEKEDCLICEYKFPIKDLPGITIFRSIAPVINSIINESEIKLPFQQKFRNKSPRAPPLI